MPSSTVKSQGTAGGAAARLRADIDCGRTAEKIDWPDPAAAPLGTDDEAAGVQASVADLEATRVNEISRRGLRPQPQPRRRMGAAWVLIALIIGIAAGLVALVAT